MERITSFEDLKCWQTCRSLRVFVAKKVVSTRSKDEPYRLEVQPLRYAPTTTAQISEAHKTLTGYIKYLKTTATAWSYQPITSN